VTPSAPEPHRDLPLDQILQGDCTRVLETLPPNSVDLIFADPPYNLQLRQELWRPNRTRVNGVSDDWDQIGSFAEYDAFTEAWLRACRRVLKDNGSLWVIGTYHNIFRVGVVLQNLGFWILNDVVWIKSNPMPNFRGVRFTNAHETLIWAQKERTSRHNFNHQAMKMLNDSLQMRSDWYLPICSGRERLRVDGVKAHSTQKPESLLYRVLMAATQPGDVVLDPFFGSGTTGAVARRLRRHWIGIERDSAYVELAQQRIAETPVGDDVPSLYNTPDPRQQPRIPFGSLLENGLLQVGQTLHFAADPAVTARVCADGALEFDGQRGSIHAVARLIQPGPANGWKLWCYEDPTTHALQPIDHLRQLLRESE